MPGADTPRVLILGGTAEAAALARALADTCSGLVAVTTSLAGRTRKPAALPGRVRRGGFGGAAALAAYLTEQRIAAVVDATHPFAAQISANAVAACAAADVPRLVLSRPAWTPRPGDNWVEVDTMEAAAGAVPRFGRRAFLTIGVQDLGAFAGLADIWFLVRLIDKPAGALPLADYRIITGRGPFTAAAERSLMEDHRVEMLVTKASGGAATAAKLDAARYLGMPVIMVCRPPVAPGTTVCDVSAALAWIRDGLRT